MKNLWNNIMNHKGFTIAISISIIGLILLFAFGLPMISNPEINQYVNDGLLRILIGVFFALLMSNQGYRHLYQWRNPRKKVYIILFFAGLVILNNFPISAFFSGRAVITASSSEVLAFLFENIAIGFFEEIIFRTMFLVLIFQYLPNTEHKLFKAILISSLFFGVIHIVNLFYGASVSATLMQVLYSILTGMMFAVLYITTKNIWIGVIAHILYNIAGSIFVKAGTVLIQFDTITIVATVLIAVFTAYIYYSVLTKQDWDSEVFFSPSDEEGSQAT